NLMLYAKETAEISYVNDENAKYSYLEQNFEGVINSVLRWFSESPSDYIRNWAEQYLNLTTCPSCEGNKLKQESLHFRVGPYNIAALSNMPLNEFYDIIGTINKYFNKQEQIIAKDI